MLQILQKCWREKISVFATNRKPLNECSAPICNESTELVPTTTSIIDRDLKPHVPEDDVRFNHRRNVVLREDLNFELPAFLQTTTIDESAAVETQEQHS